MKTFRLFLFTVCAFLLASCSKEIDFDNSGLIGTWAEQIEEPKLGVTRSIYQFNNNGTGSIYLEKYLGENEWNKLELGENPSGDWEFAITSMKTEEMNGYVLLTVWTSEDEKFQYPCYVEGEKLTIKRSNTSIVYKRIK